ncbi:cytochrome c-type biogenesis protein [Aliikangiella coralliicola]|uniref:Cytochrome c-type biogenesis protein n=1 Tax=Aliikangiella coralliicola TaxID=2592383 RepID=A0A545UAC2_9GAMM|nr:cytochrome c-type biogenesis protein [Aliikangiella coralliicola]TQV86425.1 cytochrome c-type biogenesis protein CcmH [Aliikangiella coralliicola]
MSILNRFLVVVTLFLASTFVAASIQVYHFEDPEKEKRFAHLTQELRCPKCQNNNLADSDALMAEAIKDIIYEKLKAGESDEEIVNYLKARYGDFITYRPPVKPSTWIIWFGPFVFLVIGGFAIFRFVASRQTKDSPIQTIEVPEDNKAMLEQWRNEVDASEVENNETESNKIDVADQDNVDNDISARSNAK